MTFSSKIAAASSGKKAWERREQRTRESGERTLNFWRGDGAAAGGSGAAFGKAQAKATRIRRGERERAGKKAEKAEKERSLNLYSTTTRCITM